MGYDDLVRYRWSLTITTWGAVAPTAYSTQVVRTAHYIKIWSGGFKAQLEVRNVVKQYLEPSSTVALAIEKSCLIVYGEPEVDMALVNHFGNRIIRENDFVEVIDVA